VFRENGDIEGFDFIQYPEQRAWQILFTKGTVNLSASVLEQADKEFVADIEAQRVKKEVQIEAPILEEPGKFLHVYAETGDKFNLCHPVVYRLQLLEAVEGGYLATLAYAGSGGRVVVRPPKSLQERIDRFGLQGNSEWDITVEWQLKHMHADSQTWIWSNGELRFVYEVGETNVINVDRLFWGMNVRHDGFHLGISRNLLLDGLFTGMYDLDTYEERLKWLNAQNFHPRYKAALELKLSRAALVIRLFAGSFGKKTQDLQALLETEMFAHLDVEERRDYHNKLSNAGLFAGCFGEKTQDLQALLQTEMFAHLSPTGRQNYHDSLANVSLFDGIYGKNLGDLLERLDSPEYAHLQGVKKTDFTRKLRDVIFLTTCTEVECRKFGELAQSEEDLALFARASRKFGEGSGTGVGKDQESNPFLGALKRKYDEVRPLFRALIELSTKNDVNWDEVDLCKVPDSSMSVTVLQWKHSLGDKICRERMEACLKKDLESSSRTVLLEFKDLFEKYVNFKAERQGIMRPPSGKPAGGVKGRSRTVLAQEQVAI